MKKKSMFVKGISFNVLLLGFVSMLTDVSSEMVFPLIPLFLTSVLGAGAAVVGLVEGAAETTASFLKVVSGYLSDKFRKRKPFVFLGYGLSTITKPFFAMAYTWPFVLIFRIIERFGKGIRDAPRDALVAEYSAKKVRGEAFGLQRSLDGLGSILGATLSFFLLSILGFRNFYKMRNIFTRKIFNLLLLKWNAPSKLQYWILFK